MKPCLYAAPETARAVADARSVVVLVGGYDGSGNYGDIALLDAALDLLTPLRPGLVVLPLLERAFMADHRGRAQEAEARECDPLYFDPDGSGGDGLVPVPAPNDLGFGACYLYGGGYLNLAWGDRKLAMLRAAVALLRAGGAKSICRISSGLQVDSDWIGGLADEDAAALRSFDLLGVRDRVSGQALDRLGSNTSVSNTADDAVAVLGRLPQAADAGVSDKGLRVNLHFAEHKWVSERPSDVLDFYVEFLAELGEASGGNLAVRPLIAYLDPRVDERPGVARLRSACADMGVEVVDPILLRPTGLAEIKPELSEASLTLSCSYHVALTSLMLAVPAILLGDNSYYAQKAAGLAEDFGLPEAFLPSADDDPQRCAQAAAEVLFDRNRAVALRRQLAADGRRLRRRRTAAEAELIAHLGGAAISALSERLDVVSRQLRERAAEPARLHAQLASRQGEIEAWQRRLGTARAPLAAELRAQEAEAAALAAQETLATILNSRSWRLLAPLRRAGTQLRRLRTLLRRA